MFTEKTLYEAYSSFIHNMQNLVTIQISLTWLSKLRYIHTMKYYSTIKKNATGTHGNLDEYVLGIKESEEKPILNVFVLYISIYT